MKQFHRKYTAEQVEYLISVVPGHSYQEIAELFQQRFGIQLTVNQVNSFIGNRKLNTGRTGCFPKGHAPFNKGKKGLCMGGVETQFKKGHLPHNYKPVGTVRVNCDDYVEVKIADPNRWRGKHLLVWEEHNGPLPKGHVVIFGDGNNRNFDPGNLILVSRKQLMVLNHNRLMQNDANLTRTALIIADISSKISERKTKTKPLKQ